MYKSKDTFFSIKFTQRFYLSRFISWEKITSKVVFHTKRYNLDTTLGTTKQSSLNIKAPKSLPRDRQNIHILQKSNLQALQLTFDKSFDFNLSYWCDNSLCPKKSISMFSRSISFLVFE